MSVLAPEMVTERPTLPRDLDPDYLARLQTFYDQLREHTPGFMLGEYINPIRGERVYLTDRSDRFAALFMPTRGGKGVSSVFPNALSWNHSLFCNDPKRELCEGTAWWRRHRLHNRIFIIDPIATDNRNARFNPMAEIRVRTVYETSDAENVATAIVDPDGSGFEGESGVWKRRARDLLAGLMLHVLYSPRFSREERNLQTVIRWLLDPSRAIRDKWMEMKTTIHDPQNEMMWLTIDGQPTRTLPYVAQRAQQQLDRPDGEAGSVKSEAETYLSPYLDDTLGRNSAESDFAIADIMRADVPATIYLTITPDNMERCKPYMRLFLNLLINRNVGPLSFDRAARPIKPYTWKLGMILDEFTSTLGNLKIFANQLGFIAGYGLKPLVIAQDHQQIIETYGTNENITSNTHTIAFGAMINPSSAKFFSDMLGNYTFHQETRGHSIDSNGKRSRSFSETVDSAPLLSHTQLMNMSKHEAIAKLGHMYPIPLKKLKYYDEDSNFAHRVRKCDFASDRIPYELQTGYDVRQTQEREYREIAHARMKNRVVVVNTESPEEVQLTAAKSFLQREMTSEAFGGGDDDE